MSDLIRRPEDELIRIEMETEQGLQRALDIVNDKLARADDIVRVSGNAGVDIETKTEVMFMESPDGTKTTKITGTTTVQKEPNRGWFR